MRSKLQSARASSNGDAGAPAAAPVAAGQFGNDPAAFRLSVQSALQNSTTLSPEKNNKVTSDLLQVLGFKNLTKGNFHLNLLCLVFELYKPDGLEIDKAALTRVLDWLDETLKKQPELRDVFRHHAVSAIVRRPIEPQKYMADPDVAKEIREQVTLKWADFRDGARPDLPWTENPILFIEHVYKAWLERGVLELAHLRHDMPLYNRYTRWIRENPGDTLPLAKIVRATLENNEFQKAILQPYVPAAALSSQQLQNRRARDVQKKRRRREKNAQLTIAG